MRQHQRARINEMLTYRVVSLHGATRRTPGFTTLYQRETPGFIRLRMPKAARRTGSSG